MSKGLDKLTQLSKTQETELYSEIIAKCPAGYVRDILTDMKLDVERAITSDFGFIPFAQYVKQAEEQNEELRKAREEVAKLRAEVRTLERRRQEAEAGLYEVKRSFQKLQFLGVL